MSKRSMALAAVASLILAGCGGTATVTQRKPAASPTPSAVQTVRARLTAAGLNPQVTPSAAATNSIAALNVVGSGGNVVIIFFRDATDAHTYAAPLVPDMYAGRGFVLQAGDHVYLLGANGQVTPAERQLFERVVVAGEARTR